MFDPIPWDRATRVLQDLHIDLKPQLKCEVEYDDEETQLHPVMKNNSLDRSIGAHLFVA